MSCFFKIDHSLRLFMTSLTSFILENFVEQVNIVVGTPGRLEELTKSGNLLLSHCRFLVLDEADGLLQQGHGDMINRLHAKAPKTTSDGKRLQMIVCSATLHSVDVKRMAVSISFIQFSSLSNADFECIPPELCLIFRQWLLLFSLLILVIPMNVVKYDSVNFWVNWNSFWGFSSITGIAFNPAII